MMQPENKEKMEKLERAKKDLLGAVGDKVSEKTRKKIQEARSMKDLGGIILSTETKYELGDIKPEKLKKITSYFEESVEKIENEKERIVKTQDENDLVKIKGCENCVIEAGRAEIGSSESLIVSGEYIEAIDKCEDVRVVGRTKAGLIIMSEVNLRGRAKARRVELSVVRVSDEAEVSIAKKSTILMTGNGAKIGDSIKSTVHIKRGAEAVIGEGSSGFIYEDSDAKIKVVKGGILYLQKGIKVKNLEIDGGEIKYIETPRVIIEDEKRKV